MPGGDVPKSTERGSLSLSPSQLPEKQAKGRTGRKGRNPASVTCSGWPGRLLNEENGGREETSWSRSRLPHPGILPPGSGENWEEEHLRDEGRRGTLGNLAPMFQPPLSCFSGVPITSSDGFQTREAPCSPVSAGGRSCSSGISA